MIAKITRAKDAAALARVLHGPGATRGHEYHDERGAVVAGGKVIAGTVPCLDPFSGKRWARAFEFARVVRPRVVRNVWHCSLWCAPADRRLTDLEWAVIGQVLAERLGYGEHPWVMVRNAADHVHVAVSRVSYVGDVWLGSYDYFAAGAAMRYIEATWGLTPVSAPKPGTEGAVRPREAELRKHRREQRVPPRTELAGTVRQARDRARGKGVARFEAELTQLGINWRKRVTEGDRIAGYSFQSSGLDQAGTPVWFPAHKLDRGLAWPHLSHELHGTQGNAEHQWDTPPQQTGRTAAPTAGCWERLPDSRSAPADTGGAKDGGQS